MLAFRLAGHHLHERLPPGSADVAAAAGGLQDLPPGSAGVGLAARVQDAAPEDLDALVVVVHAPRCGVRGRAARPRGRSPPRSPRPTRRPRRRCSAPPRARCPRASPRSRRSTASAPRCRTRSRTARSTATRSTRRCASGCRTSCCGGARAAAATTCTRCCGARPASRACSRSPAARAARRAFGAPPPAPPVDDARAELVRRFLHAYGPAKPATFADWAGIAKAHARALLDHAAGELAEVEGAADPAGRRGRAGRPAAGERRAADRRLRPVPRPARPRDAVPGQGRPHAHAAADRQPGRAAGRRRAGRHVAAREARPQARRQRRAVRPRGAPP